MADENCSKCRFWSKHASDPKSGDCRRNPPVVNLNYGLIQAIDLLRIGAGKPELMTGNLGISAWPWTFGSNWCGEFEDRGTA